VATTDHRESSPRFRLLQRLGLALCIALGAYFLIYRPLQINWGASEVEIDRVMPGDGIVDRPRFVATRGMTIAAAPEDVWPWLVQIGHTRAGWYSYDLVDNFAHESARRVVPELQNIKPGDLIPVSPDGKEGFYVKAFEPNRWITWWDRQGGLSFVWALYPETTNRTRLVTRIRLRYSWASPAALFGAVLDAGDFVMMRQAMSGIRDRVEGRPIRSFWSQTVELSLWLVCFVGFVVAEVQLIRRDRWPLSAGVASLAALVAIGLVMYQPPLVVDILAAAGILLALIRGRLGIGRRAGPSD
jgi:hypothetical protein